MIGIKTVQVFPRVRQRPQPVMPVSIFEVCVERCASIDQFLRDVIQIQVQVVLNEAANLGIFMVSGKCFGGLRPVNVDINGYGMSVHLDIQ